MRILYIAPRFHTNQAPVVKSLIERGHEVSFVVQRVEMSEDKSLINPIICKPDFFYQKIESCRCKGKSNVWTENYRLRHFIPSIRSLFIIIKRIRPDVVIYREPNVFSLISRIISILLSVPNKALYTQSPCMRTEDSFKRRMKNRFRRLLFGSKIYSPVFVQRIDGQEKPLYSQGVQFIPFIMEFDDRILTRSYCKGNKINIVDIGKYRDYKDHFVLVDALRLLSDEVRASFAVSIVGQCIKDEEITYYDKLNMYVKDNNLESIVNLQKNVPFQEMEQIYLENDVFILTSKRELASVAVLEAMKYGAVCISTDYNGTASYINQDFGYLFEAQNAESLSHVLVDIYKQRDNLSKMGVSTYRDAKEKYSQSSYISGLSNLMNITL